jgi:chromosome segregation ATPase
MSLLRKGSKASLRPVLEDYHSALDHKNAIIATLNTEREALSSTQERYERVKEELTRARGRYEALMRDHEGRLGNNQERLELTVRNVQELRAQTEALGEELKLRMGALREAKFSAQQWAELAERREEEAGEARLRVQEQQNLSEVRGMEQ